MMYIVTAAYVGDGIHAPSSADKTYTVAMTSGRRYLPRVFRYQERMEIYDKPGKFGSNAV